MKKLISIFLSIIMVVNMFCVHTTAAFTDETYSDVEVATNADAQYDVDEAGDELTIDSQGTMGNMLEEEFEAYTDSIDDSQGFVVQSIEMNDKVATVEFVTNADCTLLVAVYDEAGESLIATGTTDVAMTDSIAEVTIDIETMPQYYFLKAYLIDSESFAPYSSEYTCPLYTQSMQELQEMTTDDFEADRVVNFDESVETNFAVYNEDINLIEEAAGENDLVTEDNENLTYVFENINEEISGLVVGDILSYDTGEYELIIKVASISVDGTTATITGAELELEDVFDYIKLDGESDAGEADIDSSGLDEGVTYEGMTEEDTVQAEGIQEENDTVGSKTGEISVNGPTLKFGIDEDDIKANIGLKVSLKAKLYLTPSDVKNFYIELKLQYELKSYVKVECDLSDYTKTLAELAFSNIPLLNFVFRPDFVLKVEGSIEWNGTIKGTIFGLKISATEGIELSCFDKPKVESELKAEASILIGLNIKPEVYLGVDLKFTKLKVVSGTLSIDFGIEISGSMEIYNISSAGESEKHTCSSCIDGDISLVAEASAQVQVLKKKSEKYKIASTKIKVMDWYFSFDSGRFGWGACPDVSYKTTFTVVDEKTGDVLRYVTVKCDDESVTTDENGKCNLWLYPDKYEIQFALEGYNTTKKTITVDDDKLERTIKLGYSKPISGYWPDTNVSYIVPPTRDGDLTWSLDANGHLSIWGHGNYDTAAWKNYSASIFSAYIEVDDITSCIGMFGGCSSLQTIDLSKLDTSNVTNMGNMFSGCSSLQILDLSNLDTSNVIAMQNMFNGCEILKNVNVSSFDTTQVTNMQGMFARCYGLNAIDIANYNTSNVTNMTAMFNGCSSLQTIDLSSFDTTQVTNMQQMFSECRSLQTINLNNFNTSKVVYMQQMFSGCENLERVDLSSFDTSQVTSMNGMFSGCENLCILDLSSFDTSCVTSMSYMFLKCYNLNTIYLDVNPDAKQISMLYKCPATIIGTTSVDATAEVYDQPSATLTDDISYEEDVIEEVADIAEESPDFTEDGISVNLSETNSITGVITTQSFTGLESNTVYNFYDMKDMDVANPFATDNMLYVAQFSSDADGNLEIEYLQRLKCTGSDAFVVKLEHVENTPEGEDVPVIPETIDISGATVTIPALRETGSTINVVPVVKYNGETLVEGVDYKLSGDCAVTTAGTYSIVVTGMGDYSGTKTVSFLVEENTSDEDEIPDTPNSSPDIIVPPEASISTSGIYVAKMDRTGVTAGVVTEGNKEYAEYSWWACKDGTESWFLIQDWTLGSEWLNWTPDEFGDYIIVGKVRLYNKPETESSTGLNISYHPQIKGKCQMPYTGEGGGYLIGVESYENPNQSYQYEMLVLDCTLLLEGKDAWVYTTGKFSVTEGNAGWTVWQPQYGYYWTLFRVYDAEGNLLDQYCYSFANAY